jgi:hypothetical protein
MAALRAFCVRCRACTGVSIASLAAAILMSCSPYTYSDDIQKLSTDNTSLNSSDTSAKARIAAERRLNNRMEWVSTRPAALFIGPGCVAGATPSDVCDLSTINSPSATSVASTPTSASTSAKPVEDICRIQQPDVYPDKVSKRTVDDLEPASRENVSSSLKDYFTALASSDNQGSRPN